MPYGSFGQLEPSRPFSSLISGIGAGQQMQYSALRSAAVRDALQRQQEERAALKTYAAGGGDKDLLAAAPDMWMKLNENQRKDVEAAMKDFREQAPFINPENYSTWRNEFYGRHKGFSKALLPPPEQMRTPEQVKAFVTKGATMATELERQRQAGLLAEQTKAKKKLWETVGKPELELKNQFAENLLNVKLSHETNEAEKDRAFKTGLLTKQSELRTELEGIKDEREKEKYLLGNFTKGQNTIMANTLKGIENIMTFTTNKNEVPGKIQALQAEAAKLTKQWRDLYEPLARKHGVDLGPSLSDTKGEGLPTGTDPAFDRAKALIDAMPPGPGKDAKMQQLLDRQKQLQGNK